MNKIDDMIPAPFRNRRLPYAPLSRLLFLLLPLWAGSAGLSAQTADDCLTCHGEAGFSVERDDRQVSLFVDSAVFKASIHAGVECVGCHADLAGVEEFPHKAKPAPVDCGSCHEDIAKIYGESLHGQAVAKGEKLAPRCWDCHGAHDIVPHTSPNSRVVKFNIPYMCGRCHKEGTPVSQTYNIPQDSILTHYSESIHGEGLFKQGLTVTAVCTDCHTAHHVLPHTDPRSTIYRDNVAATCRQCHGRIEQVHKKVIQGKLWQTEPNKVPVCVDCHQPHQVRKVFYGEVSDADCLGCHGKPDLKMQRDGKTISLYVDTTQVQSSIHRRTSCAQCHTGASPHLKRPCATVVDKVDCSICHNEVVETYKTSTHGQLADRGDANAPICRDCHGEHGIRGRRDPESPTFPTHVPTLCAQCHLAGHPAAVRRAERGDTITIEGYPESVHGRGLLQSGLVAIIRPPASTAPTFRRPAPNAIMEFTRRTPEAFIPPW